MSYRFATASSGYGPYPAVCPLVIDDELEVPRDARLERRRIEQPRQRNRAVEPVGRALPAFGPAAEPLALRDVRPELVEVTGEAIGLDPKLASEPALRANRAERQRSEGGRGQPRHPHVGRSRGSRVRLGH